MRFKASTAASEIKRVVAADLPLPLETISLRYADDALPDDVALVDVGVHPGDEIEVELVVTYVPPSVPERAPAPLPSALEVRVPGDRPGDEPRVVRVSIDASACQKPRYLGGYRNKRDGTVYHHAQMQTVRQRPCERVREIHHGDADDGWPIARRADQTRGGDADEAQRFAVGRFPRRDGAHGFVRDRGRVVGAEGAKGSRVAAVRAGHASEATSRRAKDRARRCRGGERRGGEGGARRGRTRAGAGD